MYKALYRKYRPQTFDDVIGQPYIVRALKNQVAAGQTGHAYLFTGVRGTGKTTCARILAKAVNCQTPVNGEPCGKCPSCLTIAEGSTADICEVDAASNNGVDYIRELRDEVIFAPAQVKYRVYIIDEVHMLSGAAFNALLKTLEEPPEHVKFILATTEVQKLPMTILSRCQRYDFRRIPASEMADLLMNIAKQEQIPLEQDAALLLASSADGAMRDAISMLELCAGSGETITAEMAAKTLGVASGEHIAELAEAFSQKDLAKATACFERVYADGIDPERLCEELLEFYRELLLSKIGAAGPEGVRGDEARKLAAKVSYDEISGCVAAIQDCFERIGRSVAPRLDVQLLIVKLCRGAERKSEPKPAEAPIAKPTPEPQKPESRPVENPEPAKTEKEEPKDDGATEPLAEWQDILTRISSDEPALYGILNGSSAYKCGGKILIDSPNQFLKTLLMRDSNLAKLRGAVDTVFGPDNEFKKIGIYSASDCEKKSADPLDKLIETAREKNIKTSVKE
ncbi:MAG TPA: DNA polymerase III subunit gamma/tau [Oscillospiraceae bacterium]|nr:DNA polymerase III subunit gamma/tau [Oscillospiraceae bacterium]HPF55220.1 DNA polymerase III subunit gamma/tau [Clostridiales bacterium]HPK36034.1 DNA polymerase III subunit gamma/tau [Oscillospiraceae bacterium]HPR75965.1 DNA polymerase III subunit gamma/tau [Oscillospiraceae bacterium]